MAQSNPGPDQPEYFGPPLPGDVPPQQLFPQHAPAQHPFAQQPFPAEIYLPHPSPVPAPRGGRGRKIVAGAAALAVLAGGAAAAYAYTVLASGGIQPERVLPATTVAFAKLDLDPAASQKVAAYRLSGKFPAVSKGAPNLDAEKNALLSTFIGDQSDFDYDTEIKPWLGNRIAVAAVPDTASQSGVDPVLAVAYTDEAKMKAALSKASQAGADLGYVTLDGYALISDSQPHAEAALAGVRRGKLSDLDRYRADLRSLHGAQIAVGWADMEAAADAFVAGRGAASTNQVQSLTALSATRGRIVLGAHVSSDYLEVTAVSHVTTAGGTITGLARRPVNGTLAKLPSEGTSAAVEVTGLGDSLSAVWAGASKTLGLDQQFQSLIEQTGLRLPEDLRALFGTDATVSVRLPRGANGTPEVAAQISTASADRAMHLLDSLGAPFGLPPGSLHTHQTAGGYLLSNSAGYDPRGRPGARTVGEDPAFAKAVPDRADAGLIAYVNLAGILDSDPEVPAKEKADWKHLGALGLCVVPTPDGTRMVLRLTTR
jgi:hypothetical protein